MNTPEFYRHRFRNHWRVSRKLKQFSDLKLQKPLHIILLCLVAACLAACNHSAPEHPLESGNLVFVASQSSGLGGAINGVTQTAKATNYIHIGILEATESGFMVLHADEPKGVIREPLAAFIERYPVSHAYRIQELSANDAKAAIKRAKSHLGEPYNYSYIIADEGMYCSEFVYEAFDGNALFELNPMTFKASNDSLFHPFWQQYYDSLKIEIPEGEPGCNPNGMANNPQLLFLGALDRQGLVASKDLKTQK